MVNSPSFPEVINTPQAIRTPEVICGRLSQHQPDSYHSLLECGGYRQYVFLFSGQASVEFDGRCETIKPGAVVSIPAKSICHLHVNKRSEGFWLALLEEFQTTRIIAAMPSATRPQSPFWNMYYSVNVRRELVGPAHKGMRKRVFSDLLSAQGRLGLDNDALVAGYMLVILFSSSNEKVRSNSCAAHRSADSDLLLAFRKLLEQHFREQWNNADYCRALGVTPRRLLNACKKVTGKFPKALIHERVMREARSKLVYSKLSIAEIAYFLGFENAAYFSHFYKRNAGVSPRQELARLADRQDRTDSTA